MIDEKVLIEELKKRIASHEKDADDFAGETIYSHITETLLRIADETQAVIELVEEQPKIATDTNVGCKWIPCSERLPDETDYPEQHFRILASCSDGIVRNATIKSLRQTEEKHMNRGYYFTYVAWMPLPEPMGEK